MDQQAPDRAATAGGGNRTMLITCLVVAAVALCGVVPVVGVLAAIAIPNFIKFQCKAKQSEAKSNLMALYTAEKSFQAEYGFYTSDLVALRWSPEGSPRYVYGFSYTGPEDARGGPADHDIDRSDTAYEEVVGKYGYSTAKMVTQEGNELDAEDLPEESYVRTDEFVAAAVGDLKSDLDGRLDVWTIDDRRTLVNVVNDCR